MIFFVRFWVHLVVEFPKKKKTKKTHKKRTTNYYRDSPGIPPRPLSLPITPMTNTRHSIFNLFTLPNRKLKNRIVSIAPCGEFRNLSRKKWNFGLIGLN